MINTNLPTGYIEEDIEDEELEDENECECGMYKNENRKMCDKCLYPLNKNK